MKAVLTWEKDGKGSMPTLNQVKRAYIEMVLEELKGNKTKAARALEIDRRTLHRELARMKRG